MHKYKVVSGVIICLLTLSLFIVFCNVELCSVGVDGASGQDIYVDDDQRYPDEANGSLYNPFYSIQNAISAAQDGDTIKILSGEYRGDLIVDKSVTITTDDPENTNITSNQKNAYMIDITADSVSLEGLLIQDNTSTSHRKAVIHISSNTANVKIIDSSILYSRNGYGIQIDGFTTGTIIKNNTLNDTRGIYIENSNSVSIYSNTIENCTGSYPALKLVSSDGNFIEENRFENSIYGVYLQSSSNNYIFNNIISSTTVSGIVSNGGTNNDVVNNIISDNGNIGIDIDSSDGVIAGNTIDGNYIGLRIDGSDYDIYDNIIRDSKNLGISAESESHSNAIYNNTFKDKIGSHALEKGNNYWDNGIVGNYWDDFYGPDPSNINNTVVYDSVTVPDIYKYTRGGVTDNYPKGVFQKQPEISNPSPANLAEGVDRTPVLRVDVEDPDPDHYKERLDVYFYYFLEGNSNLIGARYNVESGGEASIAFSSTIQGKNAVYSYKGLGYGYIGVWFVEVEDSYSKAVSPIWIFSTADPPANNTKPTVDIDVQEKYLVDDEIHAHIGDSIQFDASGCDDSDGEIVFYRWSFGDGTATINEVSSIHSYKSEGTYNINLAVIDDDGSSNSANMTVVIGSSNRAPSAIINVPATGYVGDSIEFNSSGSSDPDIGDNITSYQWSFGDGATSAEQNPTHHYSKDGRYPVTLKVTDQKGAEGTATIEILIKTKSTDESPGFEIILAIIAMLFVSIILRKKKK